MQIFAASHLLPVSSPPVAGGALAVADGRIIAAGTLGDLRKTHAAPVREFAGCVIMPGLVNAHTHLELTHFPAWKLRKGIDYSPRTYVDWVIQVIKIRRALSRDELVNSVREGIYKSLECGTTAIGEILTDRSLLPLYGDSPLSGRLYCEAIGQDPVTCDAFLHSFEKVMAEFKPGSLMPGISPHAPHTLSSGFLAGIAAVARRLSIPLTIHLAETREEMTFLHDSTGRIADQLYPFAGWEDYLPPPRYTTPVSYLDSLGVLNPATSVVHCVHVTPSDAEILRQREVTAVLCPRSNDRLAVGRAPVHLLKKAGIPLALGTDSLASNDSLSLWDEMRFLRRQFPEVFTPEELLELATMGSARALHLQQEIGSLEPGKLADFLVVKAAISPSSPGLHEAVIEHGQIEEVFIGGRQPAQE
jgi:cytosine/adenosine deaminase-related metal-dependent hydrolase